MSRDRFKFIGSNLHFVDNTKCTSDRFFVTDEAKKKGKRKEIRQDDYETTSSSCSEASSSSEDEIRKKRKRIVDYDSTSSSCSEASISSEEEITKKKIFGKSKMKPKFVRPGNVTNKVTPKPKLSEDEELHKRNNEFFWTTRNINSTSKSV